MHEDLLTTPEQSVGSRLHERIVHWDNFFRNASLEECAVAQKNAITELDELLNMNNILRKGCVVNGIGKWSEFVPVESKQADDGDTIDPEQSVEHELVVREGNIVGKQGLNNGFYLASMEPKDHPSLWCSFSMDTYLEMPHPTIKQSTTTHMYVKAESMSVVSVDSINEAFVGEDCEVGVSTERLSIFSDQLAKLVRSTKFRRTKRSMQLKQVEAIIDAAESANDIRDKDILLEGSYAYTSELSEGSLEYRFVPISDFMISGVCLGVTMAGKEMLDVKAIRRDDDLLSKYDGLAINVEVETVEGETEHPSIVPGIVIKVPISGQWLEAYFESSKRHDILNV